MSDELVALSREGERMRKQVGQQLRKDNKADTNSIKRMARVIKGSYRRARWSWIR
jgi:hypothetical protein